jgi:hypothetical protein
MPVGMDVSKWGRHGFDGNACGQEAYRGAKTIIANSNQFAYAA